MQYQMQNEAPPQYAQQAQIVNAYMARGVDNPYTIIYTQPQFERDHFALGGAYASAIILRHPIEFLLDSIPFGLKSLPVAASGTYHLAHIQPGGPYGAVLNVFYQPSLAEFATHALFPLFALLWLVLLLRKRTTNRLNRQDRLVPEMMCALSLLALYGLILDTVGTYALDTAARVHTAFDPLLTIIIAGGFLYGIAPYLTRFLPRLRPELTSPHHEVAPVSSVAR